MRYTKAVLSGVGWVGALQLVARSLSFVKFGVVALLLSPQDLGTFGLVILVLSLSEVFTEIGLQTFLIQRKDLKGDMVGSVWVVMMVRSLLLFFVVLSLAEPAAVFFHNSALSSFLIAVAFIPLCKGFENPYVILFQKRLAFKKELLYRSIYIVTDVAASLLLVILLMSIWGLVLGLMLSTIVGVTSSWLLLRERPRLAFSTRIFTEVFTFMKAIVPMNIANFTVNQFDALFIGRIFGAGTLGIYQLSQRFSSQPLVELSDVVGKVTLPAYVAFSKDRKRLVRAYLRVFSVVFFSGLAGAVLLFGATSIFISFLGSEWESAKHIFPILLVYGLVMAVWGTTGSLLFSIGGQNILKKIALLRFIVTVPLTIVLGMLFAAQGVAFALLLGIILILPVTMYYSVQAISTKPLKNIQKKFTSL